MIKKRELVARLAALILVQVFIIAGDNNVTKNNSEINPWVKEIHIGKIEQRINTVLLKEKLPINIEKMKTKLSEIAHEWKVKCFSKQVTDFEGLQKTCKSHANRTRKQFTDFSTESHKFSTILNNRKQRHSEERRFTSEEINNLTQGEEVVFTPIDMSQLSEIMHRSNPLDAQLLLSNVVTLEEQVNIDELMNIQKEFDSASKMDGETIIFLLLNDSIRSLVRTTEHLAKISPLTLNKHISSLKRRLSGTYINHKSFIAAVSKTFTINNQSVPFIIKFPKRNNDENHWICLSSSIIINQIIDDMISETMFNQRTSNNAVGFPREKRGVFAFVATKAWLFISLFGQAFAVLFNMVAHAITFMGMKLGLVSSATVTAIGAAATKSYMHLGSMSGNILGSIAVVTGIASIFSIFGDKETKREIMYRQHIDELDKEISRAYELAGGMCKLSELEIEKARSEEYRQAFIATAVYIGDLAAEADNIYLSYMRLLQIAKSGLPQRKIEDIELKEGQKFPNGMSIDELFNDRDIRRTATEVIVTFKIPVVSTKQLELYLLALIPQNSSQLSFSNGATTKFVALDVENEIKYAVTNSDVTSFLRTHEPLSKCDLNLWLGKNESQLTCHSIQFNWVESTLYITDILHLLYNPYRKNFALSCNDEISESQDPIIIVQNCTFFEFEEIPQLTNRNTREASKMLEFEVVTRENSVWDSIQSWHLLIVLSLMIIYIVRSCDRPPVNGKLLKTIAMLTFLLAIIKSIEPANAQANIQRITDSDGRYIMPVNDDVMCLPNIIAHKKKTIIHKHREMSNAFSILSRSKKSMFNIFALCDDKKLTSDRLTKICAEEVEYSKIVFAQIQGVYDKVANYSVRYPTYPSLLHGAIKEYNYTLRNLKEAAQAKRDQTTQLFTSTIAEQSLNQTKNSTSELCKQQFNLSLEWPILCKIFREVEKLEDESTRWKFELTRLITRPLAHSELKEIKDLNELATVDEMTISKPSSLEHDDAWSHHVLTYTITGLSSEIKRLELCVLRPNDYSKFVFSDNKTHIFHMQQDNIRYKVLNVTQLNNRLGYDDIIKLKSQDEMIVVTRDNLHAKTCPHMPGYFFTERITENMNLIHFNIIQDNEDIVCYVIDENNEKKAFVSTSNSTDTFVMFSCDNSSLERSIVKRGTPLIFPSKQSYNTASIQSNKPTFDSKLIRAMENFNEFSTITDKSPATSIELLSNVIDAAMPMSSNSKMTNKTTTASAESVTDGLKSRDNTEDPLSSVLNQVVEKAANNVTVTSDGNIDAQLLKKQLSASDSNNGIAETTDIPTVSTTETVSKALLQSKSSSSIPSEIIIESTDSPENHSTEIINSKLLDSRTGQVVSETSKNPSANFTKKLDVQSVEKESLNSAATAPLNRNSSNLGIESKNKAIASASTQLTVRFKNDTKSAIKVANSTKYVKAYTDALNTAPLHQRNQTYNATDFYRSFLYDEGSSVMQESDIMPVFVAINRSNEINKAKKALYVSFERIERLREDLKLKEEMLKDKGLRFDLLSKLSLIILIVSVILSTKTVYDYYSNKNEKRYMQVEATRLVHIESPRESPII